MKKIIALLLAVCMLGALCAFADATDGQSASTAGENSNTDPIVVTDDETVLAFTGDQHGETEGYQAWIEDMIAVYGDKLALLSYSGDVCEKNWEQDVFDDFAAMLEAEMPGAYNVTTGNQEFKSGAPGSTWDDLGDGYTRVGEAAATDDYLVYDFGAASETMAFTDEDIDALSAYLDAAPDNIPIFVLSHYPLHLSVATDSHSIPGGDHRQSENNAKVIEVLNQHPNVIFLWGHNHTFADPRYGTIRSIGSKFTYDYENPTDKAELNFTYANYGDFCRGDTYGVLAEITRTDAGVQVSMHFVDEDVYMANKDSAVITIADDGTVTADITDGDGIDMDEILSMSGYPNDPNFADEF